MWNWLKNRIKKIVIGLIIISFISCITGFIFLFCNFSWISIEQTIVGIIIPMICALVGASIPIAMDNSLSNKRLKISLNRLKRWWENYSKAIGDDELSEDRSEDKKFKGEKSKAFDYEYRFITKNRGKSEKEIIKEMKKSNYFENKYNLDKYKELGHNDNITDGYCIDWINEHFLY